MAETPFSPESGAGGGDPVPEDGNQGCPIQLQPSSEGSPEPLPEAAGTHEAVAVEDNSAQPAPSDSVAAPEPSAATVEPSAAAPGFGLPAAASTPMQPPADPGSSAPVAAAEPEQAVPPPGVAATITVPPLEGGEANGGGEWELLVERFTTWWNSGELNRQWQRIRGPLKGVAILVVVLLAVQVYATIVRTVDGIPLVSGLLELTGLIAVLQFSATRLLRSSDREEVFSQLQRRWLEFRGRN
jgi:hypothetical protein